MDVDIKGYFDNIPHAPLMKLVKERIADGKVMDLIGACLKQPVAEEGKELVIPDKGSPQGGVICQHWRKEKRLAVSAALRLPPAGQHLP